MGRAQPDVGLLLLNVPPLEGSDNDPPEAPRRTIEEIDELLRDYIGLTGKNRAKGQTVESQPPWDWTGQPFPVGGLMHSAVKAPKAFCKLFVGVLATAD